MSRIEIMASQVLRINLLGQLMTRKLISESRYGTRMSWNLSNISSRSFSSSSDDEKSDKSKESGKGDVGVDKNHSVTDKSGRVTSPAKKKLNDLLKSIVQDSDAIRKASVTKSTQVTTEKKVNMQLAGNSRRSNIEKQEGKSTVATDPSGKKISPDSKSESLSPELVKAVKTVADALGGDAEATQTELVQKLKTQTGKLNLSELFVGMKIDRTEKQDSSGVTPKSSGSGLGESRAQYVRKQLRDQPERPRPAYTPRTRYGQQAGRDRDGGRGGDRQQQTRPGYQYSQVGLFQANPLGIFSVKPSVKPSPDVPVLKTWDSIHQKELKLAVTHPPANGFEEMILWTDTGKLWKFPIDNEQDIGEEASVGFQDHVFLEPHLDPWCPKKGPIRHFMEIVCTALGKNSYLSAKEKRECIEWYHTYFKGKEDIIKEVGAGTIL